MLGTAFACGTTPAPTKAEAEVAATPAAKEPRTDTAPDPEKSPDRRPRLDEPPAVTLRSDAASLDLQAHTYCYGNVCADGLPQETPPSVGEASEVFVDFPEPGWSFEATFERVGERCARRQTVELEPAGDGSWVLPSHGPAGTYDVTLFGRGNGDLFTVFRWSTPTDGPLTTPEARLALVAGDVGRPDSYGVELMLENLARTPDAATATITTTAADGETSTFTASRADRGCWPEGTVYWDGPDREGAEAADLGPAPFTYRVEVVLDGRRHVATAQWPEDEIKGNEPSVALVFDSALPAQS